MELAGLEPGDGETRKIDAKFVRDYLGEDLNHYTFLIVGPPGMVEGVQKALEAGGANEENVIAERYTGYERSAPRGPTSRRGAATASRRCARMPFPASGEVRAPAR